MPEGKNTFNDLYEKLGNISGTQSMILQEMRAGFKRLDECINGHETRIACVETFKSNHDGAEKQLYKNVTILGMFSGGFVAAVIWVISKFSIHK